MEEGEVNITEVAGVGREDMVMVEVEDMVMVEVEDTVMVKVVARDLEVLVTTSSRLDLTLTTPV